MYSMFGALSPGEISDRLVFLMYEIDDSSNAFLQWVNVAKYLSRLQSLNPWIHGLTIQ